MAKLGSKRMSENMKRDNRFVSPPGTLEFTGKKKVVTNEDIKTAHQTFDSISKELNLTHIDNTELELIRARKKQQSGSPATAQHKFQYLFLSHTHL
ncbi:MAG TPA: hypothetical protein VN429_06660 [Methanospirillum sp.]|nr:hypothetical protein [Methanospirillum sp.]